MTKTVCYEKQHKINIQDIRKEVFIKEQGIDEVIEFDGLDEEAKHVLVYTKHKAIATGRILKDGKIGRVAVLKEFRHKGVGVMVMKALIQEAQKKLYSRVYLDAQESAVLFYENLGFIKESSAFVKANIVHQRMQQRV